jgi:hypothetical protein
MSTQPWTHSITPANQVARYPFRLLEIAPRQGNASYR